MLYQLNLPLWERLARFGAGAAMAACGLVALAGTPIGYVVAGVGAFTALTGMVGFCPACAMVGRKLDRANET